MQVVLIARHCARLPLRQQAGVSGCYEHSLARQLFFSLIAIAALNNFLLYGVHFDLTNAFAWANIKKWALILTVMFVSSAALMYFFVSLVKRRTRETDELKATVLEAIHEALEQSSFNPHLNKRHEQFTR